MRSANTARIKRVLCEANGVYLKEFIRKQNLKFCSRMNHLHRPFGLL